MAKQLSLNLLSAKEIVSGTQAGAFSCEDVARACLNRIETREATVKAWSFLDPISVIREAKALDDRPDRGPLRGVPVGIKDIIETHDMPTGMGSPIYRDYRSPSDASCVAILRAAGALILGKTVTCEFAGVTAGPTSNPHDALRTPGGSSSGSAAAVADFMTPLAIGTQTGGSVQRPSSYCGIVGYKPTFEFINTQGLKSAAQSLDTIGLMARTVEDIELAARVLTNSGPATWLSSNVSIKVGVCRTYAWDTAENATRYAIEDASQRLAKVGFSIRDVVLPQALHDLPTTREIINDFERARAMASEWRAHRNQISSRLQKTIRNGLAVPRERYINAIQRVDVCRHAIGDLFSDIDVLLTPTAQGEAPIGLEYTGDHQFQSLWTQLRTPTITLPTHSGPNGMPIGIQLVAPRFADQRLLVIAQRLFDVLGHGPIVSTSSSPQ